MPGTGYDKNVFLNCPFDRPYHELFRAVTFAVQDCGFRPRCAIERDDSSEVRIDKIYRIVDECRYGIHDLSRTELDHDSGLPRFNMPFELGVFLGAKRYGVGRQSRKECLVLDRKKYRYQRFLSDISGQDIQSHGNYPVRAIRAVRNWLSDRTTGKLLPSGDRMHDRFEGFRSDLPVLCSSLRLTSTDLTFNELTALTERWLKANAW